jgi:predicted double-glycine peptidase
MAANLAFLLVASAAPLAAQSRPQNTEDDARHYVRSFLEIRQQNVVMQQWDLSCGAAALATILTYQHNDPVPERTIAGTMLHKTSAKRVQEQLGFSLLDLKRFAERRGYEAMGYAQLTVQDLVEFGPTIVPLTLNGYSHFVVFRGVEGDRILFADPAFGNRSMPIAAFEDVWGGRIGFVVKKRDGRATVNRLAAEAGDFVFPQGAFLQSILR